MPVALNHHQDAGYLEVVLSGKVNEADYEAFTPVVESLIKQYGKVRMLVELRDFHGWTFTGLWEDIKFEVKHFNDFQRLAIVGESRWEAGMATFCKPFTTATIRYFETQELAAARQWVQEGSTMAAPQSSQA